MGKECVKQCSQAPNIFVENSASKVCVAQCSKFYRYSVENGVISLICQDDCQSPLVQAVNEMYSNSSTMCAPTCQLFASKVYQSEAS